MRSGALPFVLALCPLLVLGQHTSEVVVAVKKHFFSECIYLLYDSTDGERDRDIWSLQKRLSDAGVTSTTLRLQVLGRTQQWPHCRRNRPLYVLMGASRTTARVIGEVSKNNSLSGPIWLLFLEQNTTSALMSFFMEVYVPLDCQFLVAQKLSDVVQLTYVYHVRADLGLNMHHFGMCSPGERLTAERKSLYQQRADFQGIVLQGTVVNDPPYTILKEDNNIIHIEGFVGQVWNLLQKDLNFTTSLRHPNDEESKANGSWCAMVEMIKYHEVDLALNVLAMASDRVYIMDFTQSLFAVKYFIFVRTLGHSNLVWRNILAPFSSNLWLTILCVTIVLSGHLSLFCYLGQHNRITEVEDPGRYSLADSMFYILGVFTFQGNDVTPRSTACRLVCTMSYMIIVVLLPGYSAALISYLTVKSTYVPFQTLEGLLEDGTYMMGVIESSAESYIIQYSQNEFIRSMYVRLVAPDPQNLLNNVQAGIHRVCSINFAFLTSLNTASEMMSDSACNIVVLPKASISISLAIGMVKKSPYRAIINHNLHILLDGGIWRRLYLNTWTHWKDSSVVVGSTNSVDLYSIVSIVIVFLGGIAIAGIMLLIECRQSLYDIYHTKHIPAWTIGRIKKYSIFSKNFWMKSVNIE